MRHFDKCMIPLFLPCMLAAGGCAKIPGGSGTITVSLGTPASAGAISLKDGGTDALPDTEDFILSVCDSKGKAVYEGRFGDSPDELEVPAGSYTVSAASIAFDALAFGSPCFSDSRVVVVEKGQSVGVSLLCTQSNCGIRAVADKSFMDAFPDAEIVYSSESGSLSCGYSQDDYAYFDPGAVSVSLRAYGESQMLFSRLLEAQQMLTVSLSTAGGAAAGGEISISVDSSRSYLNDSYRYGEDYAGDIDNAYDVTEARMHPGEKDVWVLGYIVGVATGTGKVSFEGPFDRQTNIVLGGRSSTADTRYCLSVELKSGKVRDELNLQDNPSLEGRQVYLKGDLVSAYYGIPGLKNVSEYQFK